MSFLVVGIGLGVLKITVTLSSFRSPVTDIFVTTLKAMKVAV